MSNLNRLYPHLLPDDINLWLRFLDKYGSDYDKFEYDVRIGTGRDPGSEYNDNIRTMAVGLSQRRIDALGFRPGLITIIEITVSAGLKAIGQLESYPILYRQTFSPNIPVNTLLVAETIQSDIITILNNKGIPYVILPNSAKMAYDEKQ